MRAHEDNVVQSHLIRFGFIKDYTVWTFYSKKVDASGGALGGSSSSSTNGQRRPCRTSRLISSSSRFGYSIRKKNQNRDVNALSNSYKTNYSRLERYQCTHLCSPSPQVNSKLTDEMTGSWACELPAQEALTTETVKRAGTKSLEPDTGMLLTSRYVEDELTGPYD